MFPIETPKIMSAPDVVCIQRREVGVSVRRAAMGFVLLLAFLPAVGCAMKKILLIGVFRVAQSLYG